MKHAFLREYDFRSPLDDAWQVIPGDDWSFEVGQGHARFANRGDGDGNVYLRPCSIYGECDVSCN